MLIFLADGRLGNQIFQYVFLKTIQKNDEKIIVSGFEDLLEVFLIEDIVNINKKNRWIRALLFRIIKPILTFLSEKSLVSSITVKHETILKTYRRETINYLSKVGFLKKIIFVKLGFFQSEKFFDKPIAQNLKIKSSFLEKATEVLKPVKKKYKVFVHIRRGDYKDFKVYGKSSLLPTSYFHNQIKWFLENRKNVHFVFLSDEPEFIEKEFDYLENKIISKNSYKIDFAIMTLCNGAILSPSSFGWWGSYLMKDRDVVFAPKYWLGFNSGVDYQENTIPSYTMETIV